MTDAGANMIEHVYATGDQLRWAAELALPALPAGGELVLAGMGGSGMAARVGALTVSGVPVTVEQGYELPPWAADRKPVVVAVSYSGDTEETLAVATAALDRGLPVVAVTTGGDLGTLAADMGHPVVAIPSGLQPRAALAYQAGAVVRVLAAVARAPDPRSGLVEAAALVDDLLGRGDGPAASLGRDLADALYPRVSVVYGGRGPASVAASRWKAQINENAKMPAFASEVPELDHNELEGWGTLVDFGRRSVGLVLLHDPAGHERVEKRMRLTRDVLEEGVTIAGEVVAQGTSPLDRFFSLAVVGDVASVTLADIAGVDATPVALLEEFKKRLKED